MNKQLLERAVDMNDAIEFSLGGWPLLIYVLLLAYSAYSVVSPSNFFIFWHWQWSAALVASVLLWEILRNTQFSPFYLGPALKLTAAGIAGRGRWGNPAWSVSWSEYDHAVAGRAVAIYSKGMKSWQRPFLQYAPFNVSPATIVKCIDARSQSYSANTRNEQNAAMISHDA